MHIRLLSLVFFTVPAMADIIVATPTGVFTIPVSSKLYRNKVTEKRVRLSEFAAYNLKEDGLRLENGAQQLKSYTPLKKPITPKKENIDPCTDDPRPWLKNGKQIGHSKQSFSVGLEIPPGFREAEKNESLLPQIREATKTRPEVDEVRAKGCLDNTRFYKRGDKEVAFTDCSDGTNDIVYIFEKIGGKDWKLVAPITMTANCP